MTRKEGQDKEGSNASELPSGEFDKLLFRLICAMILYEVYNIYIYIYIYLGGACKVS